MSDALPETLLTPSAGTSPEAQPGTTPETTRQPTTPETAPAAEAPAAPAEPEKPAEPAPKEEPPAEVDYATALKLPEGFAVLPAEMEAFAKIAGEAKLTAEQAQQIVDLQVARETGIAEAEAQRSLGWKAEAERHPWLTGQAVPDGGFASMQEAQQYAAAALDALPDEIGKDLRSQLAAGLGNHAGVILLAAMAGRALKAGRMQTGQPSAGGPDLRAMFPNSPGMFKE